MAKKNKEKNSQMARPRAFRAVYRIIDPTGVIPVARPSSNIQLTPIVQPVSFVPQVTQAQPLYMDEEGY